MNMHPMAVIKPPAPKKQQPLTRKQFRRIQNAIARAYAPGREDRIAAAQAKRDRRAAKRAAHHGVTA